MVVNDDVNLIRNKRMWSRLGWAIAGSLALAWTLPVAAAETIILRDRDQSISLSVEELQTFVESGETSPQLQEFIEQVPQDPTRIRELMNSEIPDTGKLLGANDLEFMALQLNKVVGEPLGRPITEPLVETLTESFADDRAISILEIIEEYDGDEVKVELARLDRVNQDLTLFVSRIEPILEVITVLLPELVCECELAPTAVKSEAIACPFRSMAKAEVPLILVASGDLETIAQRSSLPEIPGAQRVSFRYGLFSLDFQVDELTTFAETGEYPAAWNTYFNLANIDPENLRGALTREFPVDAISLNDRLNSILGEYLLFQVSRVIHGEASGADIQVLRSALVRSALSEGRLTFLEFLQNFPLPLVVVEGLNLTRFSRNVNQEGVVRTATFGLENMLLELQSEVADDICNCVDENQERDN